MTTVRMATTICVCSQQLSQASRLRRLSNSGRYSKTPAEPPPGLGSNQVAATVIPPAAQQTLRPNDRICREAAHPHMPLGARHRVTAHAACFGSAVDSELSLGVRMPQMG
jgi:hypothetical protein